MPGWGSSRGGEREAQEQAVQAAEKQCTCSGEESVRGDGEGSVRAEALPHV